MQLYSDISVLHLDNKVLLQIQNYPDKPPANPQYPNTERELQEIEFQNQLRSLRRTLDTFRGYSSANAFEYVMTLSFNAELNNRDVDLATELTEWMRRRFKRLGTKPDYMLVIVKTPNENLHLHMLLRNVPKDEFKPVQECKAPLTKDMQTKINAGAQIYGWDAFNERFNSISYIQHIGDYDENGNKITQEGKTIYFLRQYVKLDGWYFNASDELRASVENYFQVKAGRKNLYRHSKNLKPPKREKHRALKGDLQRELGIDLSSGYGKRKEISLSEYNRLVASGIFET